MSWSVRLGFRLLFWLAECLLGDALSADRRESLRALIVSFNNESMPKLER
jgi:hypothetical protein